LICNFCASEVGMAVSLDWGKASITYLTACANP
jgi:hypothetical protein